MESNINKLRMKEILNKVGFPVTINEFRNTYKYNVNLDTAIEFENKLKQIRKISDIERIICEYEEIFDKEIYVFHIARLLEQDIENMKKAMLLEKEGVNQFVFTNDESGQNKRRFFVNAKNLLKNCDVIDITMKKKSKGEFEIYLSKDFINQNTQFSEQREKEAEEKLQKIEQKIGLKDVLTHLKNSDLTEICRYPNLAILLIVNQEKLEKNIRKYIQYIDIDKMLVLANAVYFYKHGENFYKFSKEDGTELKRFTRSVSQIVGNNVKLLQSSRFYFTIDFNEIKEKVQKLFDFESIENVNTLNEAEVEKKVEELAKEIINLNIESNNDVVNENIHLNDDENLKTSEENIYIEEKAQEETMQDEIVQEETVQKETVQEEIAQEETVQEETVQEEIVQEEIVQEEIAQEEIAQEEIAQEEIVQEETVQEEIAQEETVQEETIQDNNITIKYQYINRFIKAENKILMNFMNRKNTFFKLDEECIQEDFEEGFSIFYLPNKACYIIELINDCNVITGNATYIIDENLFKSQKNRILENRKINQKELSILKLENSKAVTKIVYTGWENSINTFFNMKTEEKYTEEEKINISKLLENVKK